MAKSDLLKQAIADAKAVKETALANAKLALQEAFAPRLENKLMRQLQMEIEGADDELEADVEMGAEAGAEMGAEAGAAETVGGMPDLLGIGVDYDNDGSYDYEGDLGLGGADEVEAGADEVEAGADEVEAGAAAEEDDLNLDEILRELEEPMPGEGDEMEPSMAEFVAPNDKMTDEGYYGEGYPEEDNIEEIIEAILRETEGMDAEMGGEESEKVAALEAEVEEKDEELMEAYRTVKHLKSVINEVNLLNAKLLYTNKLFRNFDLNEGQKMKVIENFDRAISPREAKLVFATLAESFNKPTQKRKMVKESAASRPTRTTAPSQQTTQILSEGFEMANRWKKLAGLI
jgi:hypothetical protein